jgi:hypothetical protein
VIDATAAFCALSPISLEETVDQAALLRRIDTKYVVTDSDVVRLLDRIGPAYRILEIDGMRAFRYSSRYLDSGDLRSFRWHVQERRRRFKARIRHCLDSGDRLLEVKTRGTRGETVKYRRPCSLDESGAQHAQFVSECLADAYGMRIDDALDPVLDVAYSRTTLVARAGATRITMDRALAFHDLRSGLIHRLPEDRWIVETKSANGRGDADRALLSAHVRPVSVSKYILGLALTRPELRVNSYLATVRSMSICAPDHAMAHRDLVSA